MIEMVGSYDSGDQCGVCNRIGVRILDNEMQEYFVSIMRSSVN